MKLRSIYYIWKWLLIRKWYTSSFYIDHAEYKQTGKSLKRETPRISNMKPGQVEGMLRLIKWFRDKKMYKVADRLRDKLISIGTEWKAPKKWTTSNLLGHTIPRLNYKVIKGELYIKGQIRQKGVSIPVDINYTTKQ